MWCLDIKRYQQLDEPEAGECVAVYLRRRAGLPPPAASGQLVGLACADAVEDTRELTTLGFTLRLCGAPGAPTSNSVAGRSTAGKSFGTTESASWGWESFLSMTHVCEKDTWTTGDALRFTISLDLL